MSSLHNELSRNIQYVAEDRAISFPLLLLLFIDISKEGRVSLKMESREVVDANLISNFCDYTRLISVQKAHAFGESGVSQVRHFF